MDSHSFVYWPDLRGEQNYLAMHSVRVHPAQSPDDGLAVDSPVEAQSVQAIIPAHRNKRRLRVKCQRSNFPTLGIVKTSKTAQPFLPPPLYLTYFRATAPIAYEACQ